MHAVGTNIVVRLLVADDLPQFEAAQATFAVGPIWIAKTVLLETAWVLRTAYDFDDAMVCDAFTNFLGLPNTLVEDSNAILDALALVEDGDGQRRLTDGGRAAVIDGNRDTGPVDKGFFAGNVMLAHDHPLLILPALVDLAVAPVPLTGWVSGLVLLPE